jgi:hypothetical protein
MLGGLEFLQAPFSQNPYWSLFFAAVVFLVLDTIRTLSLLGHPLYPPVLDSLAKRVTRLLSRIGLATPKPTARCHFLRLFHALRKKGELKDERDKINIARLIPTQVRPSCELWGELFQEWERKIHSNGQQELALRWGLLSDIYLLQEWNDLQQNRFATELNLYTHAILLNLYVTAVSAERAKAQPVVWVFTKMIPTDWPLCPGTCSKTTACLSAPGANEKEKGFLQEYINALRAFACRDDFRNSWFDRYIIVTQSAHKSFKTTNDLEVAFRGHGKLYLTMLHQSTCGAKCGQSYALVLAATQADAWPELLNDATFFGLAAGGDITWRYAICTTYSPTHPVILLRTFDLENAADALEDELDLFFNIARLEKTLCAFTRWVTSTRQDINQY